MGGDWSSGISLAANVVTNQFTKGNNTVNLLYSGNVGAYCVNSPSKNYSVGAGNVSAIFSSFQFGGGNPNNAYRPVMALQSAARWIQVNNAMFSRVRAAALAAAISGASTLPPAAHAAETGTHFANSRFHYEFTIPPEMERRPPESGVPVLFNYKRSEGGPQGLFPDHGANIFLIPLAAVQVGASCRHDLRVDSEQPAT